MLRKIASFRRPPILVRQMAIRWVGAMPGGRPDRIRHHATRLERFAN
ncbi:hypothetical protein ACETRX_08430 [Labrys portucalensis]|uniref:Uncharacterized protein n=1 Tax=Labrys neptuniae TaxID=376174 RepID=A0ABV6ZBV4_9HYPH|nr:hypothetical protein [Labrys sp. KNU-23]